MGHEDDFYILRLNNKDSSAEGMWQLEMQCQTAVPTEERMPTLEPTMQPSEDRVCCQCTCPWRGRGCKYRDNEECEDIICQQDSYCCWHAWDEVCAIKANAVCEDKPLPKCCACTDSGRFERGCEQDPVCEEEICEFMPFCCGSDRHGHGGFWDERCIHIAAHICRYEAKEDHDQYHEEMDKSDEDDEMKQ